MIETEFYKMSKIMITFDHTIPGLESCQDMTNAIVLQDENSTTFITRCWIPLNDFQKSINPNAYFASIKIITEDSVISLNAQDTKEYLDFNGNSQMEGGGFHWGGEDARLFEHNNELYLYYCMTNPNPQKPYRSLEFLPFKDVLSRNNAPVRGNFITPKIFEQPSNAIEKNWLFFSNGSNIKAVYSLSPFILGDILNNLLVATLQREYPCLSRFRNIHFSSNAVTVNNHGYNELIFVFNDRTFNKYSSFIGFIDANSPHHLLRISEMPFVIDLPHDKLVYSSSITVLNKKSLFAELNDSLIISGGVDDYLVFKQEVRVAELVKLKTIDCTCWTEYSMNDNRKCSCQCAFEFFRMISIVTIVLISIMGAISLFRKFKKSRYIRISMVKENTC